MFSVRARFCTWSLLLMTVISVLMNNLGQSEYLRIGVIANLCSNISTCVNETELKTIQLNNTNITTVLHWKYINSQELYQVARAVSEFQVLGISSCMIATSLEFEYVQPIFEENNMTFVHVGVVNSLPPKSNTRAKVDCNYLSDDMRINSLCQPPVGYSGQAIPQTIEGDVGHVTTIVLTLIRHVKWDEVLVLYESSMYYEIDEIHRKLLEYSILYNTSMIDNFVESDYHSVINKAADWERSRRIRFVVLCKLKCENFLLAVDSYDRIYSRMSALRHFSEIMVFSLSGSDLPFTIHLRSTMDNMIFISFPQYMNATSTDYNDFELMMHSIINELPDSNLKKYIAIEDISFEIMENVKTIQEKKSCQWIAIDTLMWDLSGRRLDTVGFTDIYGELFQISSFFPNRQYGLNGKNFMVATLQWSPFVIKNSNGSYEGLCFDIFDEIASRFNFTYDVIEPPDGEWGVELDNGSWSGVVGLLQRREIDLVVASLNVHSRREEVIDFTYPFFYDSTIILMTKEDPNKTKWRTLIDPFDETVLLCIAIALMAISFLLCVFERLSPYYCDETNFEESKSLKTFQDSFWYLYGALLTQGGDRLPHSQTGRTLLSCWWLFCLVMMASYSGNLIAFLTVNKDKLPFESVQEMINQDQYKWGLIGGSYWVTIFKDSVLTDFKRVWQSIVGFNQTDPSVLSTDPEVHIQKVLDGNYAYLGDKTQIEIKMANECSFVTGKEEVLPFQYAFGLPNQSPFTALFSGEILEIHESGLINIWKSRRWPRNNLCSGESATAARMILLVDVQSAFYLIGIGLVLASLVLTVEKIYSCYKRRNRHKLQQKEKDKERSNEQEKSLTF